jgi:hypothetical protein
MGKLKSVEELFKGRHFDRGRLAASRSAASPTPISRCRPRRAGKGRCTTGSGCRRAPRVSRNLAPEASVDERGAQRIDKLKPDRDVPRRSHR